MPRKWGGGTGKELQGTNKLEGDYMESKAPEALRRIYREFISKGGQVEKIGAKMKEINIKAGRCKILMF